MNSGKSSVRLTEQDEQLLSHLARYRLTLKHIAHLEFYPERTEPKAWGRLHALTKAGFLNSYELFSNKPKRGKYWTLGPLGVRQMGTPSEWAKPLRGQAFKRWITTLLLCFDGKYKWTRLRQPELELALGNTADGILDESLIKPWRRLSEARDYLRDDTEPSCHRLAIVRPAYERDAFAVARKCRSDLTKHARHSTFYSLLAAERMWIAVVAANKYQQSDIESALRRHFADFPEMDGIKPRFKVFVRKRLGQFFGL